MVTTLVGTPLCVHMPHPSSSSSSNWRSWGSLLTTETMLWARRPAFNSRRGQWWDTGSGAHSASYQVGTGGSFPEGKAAGTRS